MGCVLRGIRLRYPAWLKAAHGKPCVRCGIDDGTMCARHYEGLRQHQYGKGRGIKGHDMLVAWLCAGCDDELSNQKEYKSIEKSEEFLHCIALTIMLISEEML